MIKISRFFLIAFVINSIFLLGLNFENVRELFSSTVHFSVTILPAGSGQPPLAAPTNGSPANGSNVQSPLVFNVGNIPFTDAQFSKIQWVFRRSDVQNYSPPFFLGETVGSNKKTFNAPDGIFTIGETYFWKARYMNLQNTWSLYSAETSLGIVAAAAQQQQPPPIVVYTPIVSVGGYTGGYGGGGYSGGSISLPPPSSPPLSPQTQQQQPVSVPGVSQTPVNVPPSTQTPATKTPQKTAPTKRQSQKNPVSPAKTVPQKQSPGAQKPSVQEMPVNIKLEKNKIPEKQPLKIEISPTKIQQPAVKQPTAKQPAVKQPTAKQPAVKQPTAKQPAAKPTPKPGIAKPQIPVMQKIIDQMKNFTKSKTTNEAMNLDIQIRNDSGATVLKKREEIKIDKTKIEKNLGRTSILPVGNYIASFSYEKDGTVFAISDNFEIVPRKPFQDFIATALLWNEGFLPILFISSSAVSYFRRGRKKKQLR